MSFVSQTHAHLCICSSVNIMGYNDFQLSLLHSQLSCQTFLYDCVVLFSHIHTIHDDKTTIGKCIIENDIILFNRCDQNSSTHIVCDVWFAHLHVIYDDEWTKCKCMIDNDIILFDHCHKNNIAHNVYNIFFAHIHILHNDETMIGKWMIENEIIPFDCCDDNDSTHPVCCLVCPSTYYPCA